MLKTIHEEHIGIEKCIVVVDYTSDYSEVAKLEDLSSTNTISHMTSIMARHGLPSVVVSDNGPQFSNGEFLQFGKQYLMVSNM